MLLINKSSPNNLRLVEFYLKSAGYDVVTANSAEAALRYLAGLREGKPEISIDLICWSQNAGIRGPRRLHSDEAMKPFEEVPILMASVESTWGTSNWP